MSDTYAMLSATTRTENEMKNPGFTTEQLDFLWNAGVDLVAMGYTGVLCEFCSDTREMWEFDGACVECGARDLY